MSRKWLIPGGLMMAVPIVASLLPYAVGAYHLETGGRSLDAALGAIDPLNWWYVGPMAVQDNPALEKAIAHLEKATEYAHALRLLGRAHAARGDLVASVEALKRFTAQRPENPMGHLELAAAYERVNQRQQTTVSVSLLEVLPGAAVSAPDLPGEVHYQQEGWHSEYVHSTAFLLSPDEEERPALFLHAGSQVTFTSALTQPAVLSFAMGLDPRSLDWGGDGVTFEVLVDGARVFLEHLPVEVAREGWQERQVDLAAYAGQTIALSLLSTPGPVGDVTADWAGWGDPRVEPTEVAVYRRVVREELWLDEWLRAGTTAQDFVRAGEAAREGKQYEVALAWYAWAMRIDPQLGDPWYYRGLLHEDREQWEEALAAYQRATASGRLVQVHESDPHSRSGIIYQWRLEPPQLGKALASYRAALETNDFDTSWEAADFHYKCGEILRQQGASPEEYIHEFRRAIELNPKQPWAYALLGLAIYEQDRDVARSEAAILRALQLDPRNKWFLYYLGNVHLAEGDTEKAGRLFEQALQLDPHFQEAQRRLSTLDQTGQE